MKSNLKLFFLLAFVQMLSFSAYCGVIIIDLSTGGNPQNWTCYNSAFHSSSSEVELLPPSCDSICQVKTFNLQYIAANQAVKYLKITARCVNNQIEWTLCRNPSETIELYGYGATIGVGNPNTYSLPTMVIYENGVFMAGFTIMEFEEGSLFIYNNNGTNISYFEETCIDNDCLLNSFSRIQAPQSNSNNLKIAPNPTSDIVNVTFQSPNESTATVMVYNNLGQVVQSQSSVPTYKGKNNLELDLSDLPVGLYNIMIQQGDEKRTQRVMKN